MRVMNRLPPSGASKYIPFVGYAIDGSIGDHILLRKGSLCGLYAEGFVTAMSGGFW